MGGGELLFSEKGVVVGGGNNRGLLFSLRGGGGGGRTTPPTPTYRLGLREEGLEAVCWISRIAYSFCGLSVLVPGSTC